MYASLGRHLRLAALPAAGLLLAFASSPAAAADFRSLGSLATMGNMESHARAVSADGSVVVGSTHTDLPGSEMFRWDAVNGMTTLGPAPDTPVPQGPALAISDDGSVITGFYNAPDGVRAFRWDATSGVERIEDEIGSATVSSGHALSADGSTIVGRANQSGNGEAFRWSEAGGFETLGDLPGGGHFAEARGVSADGSVVVGFSAIGFTAQAFRWDETNGMVGLPFLPGGTQSFAYAVTPDGSIVGGNSQRLLSDGFTVVVEATLWDAAGGVQGLGDLPGGPFLSSLADVTPDGRVAVGISQTEPGSFEDGTVEAFVWDAANGMRLLSAVLSASGVDMTGWKLLSADGISHDGLTIVGVARTPGGNFEGYVAVLDPPPPVPGLGPLGLFLGFGALVGVAARFARHA